MRPSLCCVYLRDDTGCVICAEFLIANPAWPGANGGGIRFEGYGAEAGGVVRANGRSDDVEES